MSRKGQTRDAEEAPRGRKDATNVIARTMVTRLARDAIARLATHWRSSASLEPLGRKAVRSVCALRMDSKHAKADLAADQSSPLLPSRKTSPAQHSQLQQSHLRKRNASLAPSGKWIATDACAPTTTPCSAPRRTATLR